VRRTCGAKDVWCEDRLTRRDQECLNRKYCIGNWCSWSELQSAAHRTETREILHQFSRDLITVEYPSAEVNGVTGLKCVPIYARRLSVSCVASERGSLLCNHVCVTTFTMFRSLHIRHHSLLHFSLVVCLKLLTHASRFGAKSHFSLCEHRTGTEGEAVGSHTHRMS
jgi:hypothetical protein